MSSESPSPTLTFGPNHWLDESPFNNSQSGPVSEYALLANTPVGHKYTLVGSPEDAGIAESILTQGSPGSPATSAITGGTLVEGVDMIDQGEPALNLVEDATTTAKKKKRGHSFTSPLFGVDSGTEVQESPKLLSQGLPAPHDSSSESEEDIRKGRGT